MAIVNGSLQEGYKDAAWFAANPTLVLLVGQKVNLEQTGTYKLGDGTSQLSALSFLGGSGSGLSGLTTNKVLKATSSTTAGDSNITDDGSGLSTASLTNLGAEVKYDNGIGIVSLLQPSYVQNLMSFANTVASGFVKITQSFTKISHTVKNSFDAPLHEFNNSVTKNGVEVATLNDIPSVAGLAPLASPTFTGTVTTPAIIVSSETASRVAIIDATSNVKSADTATYPSLTELSYGKGVTSSIQTQINNANNNAFLYALIF